MNDPILIFSPTNGILVIGTHQHTTEVRGFVCGADGLHQGVMTRKAQLSLLKQLAECLSDSAEQGQPTKGE